MPKIINDYDDGSLKSGLQDLPPMRPSPRVANPYDHGSIAAMLHALGDHMVGRSPAAEVKNYDGKGLY